MGIGLICSNNLGFKWYDFYFLPMHWLSFIIFISLKQAEEMLSQNVWFPLKLWINIYHVTIFTFAIFRFKMICNWPILIDTLLSIWTNIDFLQTIFKFNNISFYLCRYSYHLVQFQQEDHISFWIKRKLGYLYFLF